MFSFVDEETCRLFQLVQCLTATGGQRSHSHPYILAPESVCPTAPAEWQIPVGEQETQGRVGKEKIKR